MRKVFFIGGNRTVMFLWSLLILTILVMTPSLLAQGGGNAAITGTVLDPAGAVISNATVKVTQKNTLQVRTITTNSDGQFSVSPLQPAAYTVTIEAAGFKKYVQDFVLLADQIRTVNAHLEIGETTQQITVSESSVQVNTVAPVLSQVIEQSRVINLPLNGRNAADLTLLVPGANTANGHGATQGDTKQVPGAESISVNGARPDQISYNLDGANNQDLMSNTNNPFPFPDALQEFSVLTNSFDAQYGANAGAVVNVVTKSGTNQFHGDVFEFVRNGYFNARNYFANKVDPLKRNQFGGTIGGPIIKDKSFFFFGYQGTRIRSQNNASNAILPTAANLRGDFSNYSGTITDPSTGQPFPDQSNIGPISTVAVNMSKYLPIDQEDASGQVTYGTPIRQDFNEYIGRFDQQFRQQDHLFARAYIDRYVHAPSYDGKDLLTVGTGSTVQTQNYAAGYTLVITPSLVNNTIVDVVRAASDRGQGGNVPQLSDFGSSVWQLPQAQGGIRNFAVSGNFTIGSFTDAKFIRNTGNIRDHLMWIRGSHTMDFGVDYEADQSNIRNTDLENGSFSITADVTGYAAASFVLGHIHSFSQTSGDYSDSRQKVIGLYANDKWKASRNLTLSLGLRWEPQVPMKEIYGRIQQFRPDAYNAGVQSSVIPSAPAGLFFVGDKYNGVSVPDTGETSDMNNFAPRVGVAYDPTGSGRTAIRAGGGMFYYSRLPGLFLNDAAIVAPFSLRLDPVEQQVGPLEDPLVNFPNFVSNFPQNFVLSTVPKDVAFPAIVSVYGLEPGVKWTTPVIYDWNITVERQLAGDAVFHASYVGLRGTHLRQDVDLNPGVYTEGSTLTLQQRRPYQPFGDVIENRNSGNSGYNALQLDVEKRPSSGSNGLMHNITLLANYTFSKALEYGLSSNGGITDVGSSKGSGMSFYDPRQKQFESGYSDFDHKHRFVASYVWNLPRMNQSNALIRNTVGGWDWTGIYTYTTGDPMTILAGKDISATGLGSDRADFIGSASQFGKIAPSSSRAGCPSSVAHCVPWLDTSLFALPTAGNYGDAGKGTFRGPTNWNMDMGLLKNFIPIPSREHLVVQFRGEFFNIFNHTLLADPNVTVSNSAFGSVRGTQGTSADSRIIQLALKVMF
ncbi:MAG TPA: carboxypeptidase regulatory-like domain-containing protein [Terracidiphilus sp.]|nr:carboxypeptidase regulatory-like domain-containing protein [Terracidiphilus sp.]